MTSIESPASWLRTGRTDFTTHNTGNRTNDRLLTDLADFDSGGRGRAGIVLANRDDKLKPCSCALLDRSPTRHQLRGEQEQRGHHNQRQSRNKDSRDDSANGNRTQHQRLSRSCPHDPNAAIQVQSEQRRMRNGPSSVLFPSKLDEVVPQEHLVRNLDAILRELDWSEFEAKYHGTLGARPVHPRVLTSIILYGHLTRILSSRPLEAALWLRVDFRWLAEGEQLDEIQKELRQTFLELEKQVAEADVHADRGRSMASTADRGGPQRACAGQGFNAH